MEAGEEGIDLIEEMTRHQMHASGHHLLPDGGCQPVVAEELDVVGFVMVCDKDVLAIGN